ncbi:IclR family transcriptional regulator [Halomarina ordinaria]|uniref:IclR family transcriptional regulator n=1 Tax=Halomarina ordinaria TaxID=3033939 RepID=A0ABD5UFN1_9EURY|nr:IclR family transcriptional regulator [Halomarina sp. PSRA2]
MARDGRTGGGSETVKSVDTTLALVEALMDLDGARVTTLAEEVGVSKSTVHKHLSTLSARDYVVRDGEAYRLGLRCLDVGGYARDRLPGATLVKAKVRELADETGEVAQFMAEERGLAVVLYREAGRNGVASRTRPGMRLPLHQVAAGKAILSRLPEARVVDIVEGRGLPRATEETITDPDALYAELEAVRERGIAFSYGESTRGLYSVATPLMAPDDDVLGACVVSGPSHRMSGDPMAREVPDLLLSVVNELELNIAHSGVA